MNSRSATRWGVWLALQTLLVGAASAQTVPWPGIDGLDIGVYIHAEAHPALSDAFVARSYRRIEQSLSLLLGSNAVVRRESYPNLDAWLRNRGLDQLSAQQCIDAGCDNHAKVMLIDLRYRQGAYRAGVREFDRHLAHLDRARTAVTLQRAMVEDAVAGMTVQAWSPVGRIVSRQGGKFAIQLPGLDRLLSFPEHCRLGPGSVLQLYREVLRGQEIQQSDGREDQFLVVTAVEPQSVQAELALPDVSDDWFRHLGQSQARYLVRRVAPHSAELQVKVLLEDTETPREGCEVHVTPVRTHLAQQPLSPIGLTNAAGQLDDPPKVSALEYVTVVYEDLTTTKVFVPGVTPSPQLFVFSYRGSRTRQDLVVRRLEDDIRRLATSLNARLALVQEASDADDADRLDQLVVEIDVLLRDIRQVAARAKAPLSSIEDFEDLKSRLTTTSADAEKLLANYNGAGIADAIRGVKIKKLQREIQKAWTDADWPRAKTLYGEYLAHLRKTTITDPASERRFADLTASLSVNDPAHLEARSTVEKAIGIQQVADLIGRWGRLQPALDNLSQLNDYFWLRRVFPEFKTWNALLEQEQNRLLALESNSGQLTLEEREALLAGLKEIQRVRPEFAAAVNAADQVIRDYESK